MLKSFTAVFNLVLFTLLVNGLNAAVPSDVSSSSLPLFLDKPIRSNSIAYVEEINVASSADIVLLNGGFDKGFGVGMICDIMADGKKSGEVILVEVKRSKAAGLILELTTDAVIKQGDLARTKTLNLVN